MLTSSFVPLQAPPASSQPVLATACARTAHRASSCPWLALPPAARATQVRLCLHLTPPDSTHPHRRCRARAACLFWWLCGSWLCVPTAGCWLPTASHLVDSCFLLLAIQAKLRPRRARCSAWTARRARTPRRPRSAPAARSADRRISRYEAHLTQSSQFRSASTFPELRMRAHVSVCATCAFAIQGTTGCDSCAAGKATNFLGRLQCDFCGAGSYTSVVRSIHLPLPCSIAVSVCFPLWQR